MTNLITVPVPKNHLNIILTLTKRNLWRFYRDKRDVIITFGQAPILAITFFLVFQKVIMGMSIELFQPLRKYLNPSSVSIIIFLAVLTAIWFGTSKAITEIPRNKTLYQQERLSFLNEFDFIISSFISLAIIVFGQIFLFSLVFHLLFVAIPAYSYPYETGFVNIEKSNISLIMAFMPHLLIKFVLLMWGIALSSIAVAMLISIIFAKTTSSANAILPFVLIIQILLGGSNITPVINMNSVTEFFSNAMVSRWGFEATVLLFEEELNISLPFSKQPFSFTNSLRANDFESYINKTKEENIIPSIAKKHPKFTVLWLYSLSKFSDDNLKKKIPDISNLYGLRKIISEKELLQNFEKLKLYNSESILNKNQIIQKNILKQTNEDFYNNQINTDFKDTLISIIDSKEDKLILKDISETNHKLYFFRFQHQLETWLVLIGITIFSLMFSWLSFSLQSKK